MGKINSKQFLMALAAILGLATWSRAGDIVGTLGVPKPDHAIVYVETVPGSFGAGRTKMDQMNKVFIPYVLPVLKGTVVEFHNSDNLQHNVFGVGAENFDLGNWTKGIVHEHTFNKVGDVTILCNVHHEMEGHILVLQNPYFARPGAGGAFRIANIPPGTYVVKAWYRGKVRKQNVTVPATGSVTVAF
jgi:plastocyanin